MSITKQLGERYGRLIELDERIEGLQGAAAAGGAGRKLDHVLADLHDAKLAFSAFEGMGENK